ncbi:PorV/PorQ family protein [bacterium]|nr:PorV/PorQ family protein [bacterium]
MKKIMIVILMTTVLSGSVRAAGFASLGMGGGARIPAMGYASAAIARGGIAGFRNPAALAFENGSSLVLSTYKWIDNLSGAFAGWGRGNGQSGFGVFALFTSIDNIEYRTGPSPEPVSTFSFYEAVCGVSYSRLVAEGLSIGISLKGYYEKIFIHEASGFGFDLGLMWQMKKFPLILGCAVQNIGRASTLNHEEIDLPLLGKIGAAVPVPVMHNKLILAADVVEEKELPLSLHSGAEFILNNTFSLRCGYQTGRDISGFTAGAGIRWKSYSFNYSYVPFSNQWHDMHRLSVEVLW